MKKKNKELNLFERNNQEDEVSVDENGIRWKYIDLDILIGEFGDYKFELEEKCKGDWKWIVIFNKEVIDSGEKVESLKEAKNLVHKKMKSHKA